jgi:hypothetical protein
MGRRLGAPRLKGAAVQIPSVSRPPLDVIQSPPGLVASTPDTTVRLLSADQVADLLGLGPAGGAVAVRVLDATGRGPVSYPVGGGRVWCRSDVLDWLRENEPRAVLREVAGTLVTLATTFE